MNATDTHSQSSTADFQRPRYHFLPPANWMNDPNGLIQWEGAYHLFYQYNPDGAYHNNIHWGHAVSPDLIHWEHWPVALTPTPGGFDEKGCWSGSGVINDGEPTLIYTGAGDEFAMTQLQGIATSQDGLRTWEKYPGNPVIGQVPAELRQTRDFRDPFVWREGDSWYMLLASRIDGVGGAVLLYKSPDLRRWEYLHPLLTGTLEQDGYCWECPNFFPLGDDGKWVLIISVHWSPGRTATPLYFVGEYKDHRFIPEIRGVLDYGVAYAPLTMHDDQDRRLLWAWLRESRPVDAQIAAGWSGVQSIPRVLTLLSDNLLGMEPAPELEQLRGEQHTYTDIKLNTINAPQNLEPQGHALDIIAKFEPGKTGLFGLNVLMTPDGSEQTCIRYDAANQRLLVDRSHTSLAPTWEGAFTESAPHPLAPGESLELRILVDGSVIEIIANQRTSLTTRAYPTQAASTGLQLVAEDSDGTLQSLHVWELASIWPD